MAAATSVISLRHLPEHRALLCTSCGYCLAPQGIDRHLKVIHHLSHSLRQPHIKEARNLDLAEPEDVVLPEPRTAPIPGVPIFSGLACEAPQCQYTCVTAKRMQAHWRLEHPRTSERSGAEGFPFRRVKLQTLFKGNNLRYFIVAQNSRSSKIRFRVSSTLQKPLSVDDIYESSTEWLLTKQFFEHSYSSLLPVTGTEEPWRGQMLRAGANADFLRCALLSVTANHVAFEHPESRQPYCELADRLRLKAIKSLAINISTITEHENFFAAFNFSRLMTICTLARTQLKRIEEGHESMASRSIIPEWLLVQRRGRALVWPYRGQGRVVNALQGPTQRLCAVNFISQSDLTLNPEDKVLYRLLLAIRALPEAGTQIGTICLEALRMLRGVWVLPFRDAVVMSYRDAALMWTARLPERYMELLEARNPLALIIFAHFCALWSYSESRYWYMKGHAESMLLTIVRCLGWPWQEWVAWPVSVVLGASSHSHCFAEKPTPATVDSDIVVPEVSTALGQFGYSEVSTWTP